MWCRFMCDVTKELWDEVHTYNVVNFWCRPKGCWDFLSFMCPGVGAVRITLPVTPSVTTLLCVTVPFSKETCDPVSTKNEWF